MNALETLLRRGWTDDPKDISGDAPFEFDFDPAYSVEGSPGIAYRVDGWETEGDEDTDWTGMVNATGRLSAHMIGDDRTFTFDPDEFAPISDDDYCGSCGQIGCSWH